METELVYRPSVDLFRLRWKVEKGRSVSSCVSVLDDGTNADTPQQPFVTGTSNYHPVSEEPFSQPPTKTFNAKIRVLDGIYADDLKRQDSLSAEEQDRQHAMLQDDKWHGPCKYITAEGNFITIREFVEAVHPWLVSLREEYLKQQGLAILGQPMRSNAWLWVDVSMVREIEFTDYLCDDDPQSSWESTADYAWNWYMPQRPPDPNALSPEESRA